MYISQAVQKTNASMNAKIEHSGYHYWEAAFCKHYH